MVCKWRFCSFTNNEQTCEWSYQQFRPGKRASSETQGQSFGPGLKGATKVFKHGRKSPWVPTLNGLFPNGQENAGSWLGTKNACYYCAQSATPVPENSRCAFCPGPTDRPGSPRMVSGQDRKITPALGTNQIAGFRGFRPLSSLEKNKKWY